MLNKNKWLHILSLTVVAVAIYYLFSFSLTNLSILIAGWVAGFFAVSLIPDKNQQLLLTLAVLVLAYATFELPLLLASFLLGLNLAAFYFQVQGDEEKDIDLSLLNFGLIAAVVLPSSIEKFRGFNKLNPADIQLTIPILILIFLTTYFLSKGIISFKENFKKKRQLRNVLLITTTVIAAATVWAVCAIFYKEIGTDKIAVPILTGLLVGLIQLLLKGESRKNVIIEFAGIFLLIVIPYQIAGLLGITLAVFAGQLALKLQSEALGLNISGITNPFIKISPLLFLVAAAEIRENRGIIMRFNLINGYQMGWILISTVILFHITEIKEKIINLLKENDILNLSGLLNLIFTLVAITFIIKFGNDEALAALLIAGSIYLFVIYLLFSKGKGRSEATPLRSKKDIPEFYYLVNLVNLIGAVAFLILSRV